MSALGDAVADTFRKHPFWMSVGGLLALSIVFGNIADAVDDDKFPQSMTCAIDNSDSKVTSGFRIHIGTTNESQVSIPAEDLQRLGRAPVSFRCEAN